MRTQSADTSEAAERVLIEGLRHMTPAQKLARVRAMTQAVQQMALARLRSQYGSANERENALRLAALWLGRETMQRVFGWDPEVEGW